MNHEDHVRLIRQGIAAPGGIWADLGSGEGAFTLALADLLGPGAQLYSIDRDRGALRLQEQILRSRFPDTIMHYLHADFTRPLALPLLDGILLANSLHFVRQKDSVLCQLQEYLKPEGRLLIVEYNVDRGNPWVPYPFSYTTWETLARKNGFVQTQLLAKRPSRFLGEIYSALSKISSSLPASDVPS